VLKSAYQTGSVRSNSMTDSDEGALRTLDAVCELAPKTGAVADEIEQGRRLPAASRGRDAAGRRVSDGDAASVGRT
jgi:hypothetical protein